MAEHPGEHVLTVDGDGHLVEPPARWAEHVDVARWGARIPRDAHPEHTSATLPELHRALSPLGPADRDRVLGAHAVAAYRLPISASMGARPPAAAAGATSGEGR